MRASAIAIGLGFALIACVNTPAPPAADRSTAWGNVALVPHEGVTPGTGSSGYSDRRLENVRFVDYSHPGFAVVYTEGRPHGREQEQVSLVLKMRAGRAIFEPAAVALPHGASIELTNDTDRAHTVSIPSRGVVRRVAPGESVRVAIDGSGRNDLFLLGGNATATVFAAPGPFTVVDSSGRFELRDLDPGTHRITVWHPRFPASVRKIDLVPGAATRIDLELGVDVQSSDPEQ